MKHSGEILGRETEDTSSGGVQSSSWTHRHSLKHSICLTRFRVRADASVWDVPANIMVTNPRGSILLSI